MLPLAEVMRRNGMPAQTDPGALKLTIRKFYRPGGASTQLKGVTSDIVVPSATSALKVSEAEMPDPLPWDKVRPAKHAELDRGAPWISTLRDASTKRVEEDQAFEWLNEDNERIKADLGRGIVSLNEKERREEKVAIEMRAEARKNKLAHSTATPETQYEITVKSAEQSGL